MVKKYENWYLWILVDVLSIGIYLYKAIPLTACLYVVYLGLAIWGWRIWRNTLAHQQEPANHPALPASGTA
jgi:nicotinamide mononucleotide transporter